MPSPRTADVFIVGHSLVSPTLPEMLHSVNEAADAANGPDIGAGDVDFQIINGAPLWWNFEHSANSQGMDSKVALATGKYDVLVMTEAVPLDEHIRWSGPSEAALRFFNLAHEANPGIQTYFYQTWNGFDFFNHDIAAWREHLDTYLPKWEGIVDGVNAGRPAGSKEMLLIPAGQAMANLYDAIERGEIPGKTSITQMFGDSIHPNIDGFFFITMLFEATIYGTNPIWFSEQARETYLHFPTVPQDLAEALQKVAYDTVLEYDRDGINDGDPSGPLEVFGTDAGEALNGTDEDEIFWARGGDDVVRAAEGADTLNGEDGNDKLYGNADNDVLNGGAGNDSLYGGGGKDALNGGAGNDLLKGGRGADKLNGQVGDDKLIGGMGDDHLNGGAGNDRMWGGAGKDTFVFKGENLGNDRIMDWSSQDVLDIQTGGSITYTEQSNGVLVDHGQGTVLLVGANIDDFLI